MACPSATRNCRAYALQRLATLAVAQPELQRLQKIWQARLDDNLRDKRITEAEIDSLNALCRAAPFVANVVAAADLLKLLEASLQALIAATNKVDSSWESLAANVVSAMLAIGRRHPGQRAAVARSTLSLVVITEDERRVAILCGALDAMSMHAEVYTLSEQLDLVHGLRAFFSQNLRLPLMCRSMRFFVSCSSLQVVDAESLRSSDTLTIFSDAKRPLVRAPQDTTAALNETMAECCIAVMQEEYEGNLAMQLKADTIKTYFNTLVTYKDLADFDPLVSWLEEFAGDADQMDNVVLARTVLRAMAAVASFSSSAAGTISKILPRLLVHGRLGRPLVELAAKIFTGVLTRLSKDSIITALYLLGNVLSGDKRTDHQLETSSTLSLDVAGDKTLAYTNVVHATVSMAVCYGDDKIAALAQSMLLQKLGRISRAIDLEIIKEAAALCTAASQADFEALLKLYDRLCHDGCKSVDRALLDAIREARMSMSRRVRTESEVFLLYERHLLECIISKGEFPEGKDARQADVELATQQILQIIPPLAALCAYKEGQDRQQLYREVWYNIAVHGIGPNTKKGQDVLRELRIIAKASGSLVSETQENDAESEVELNIILRRKLCGDHPGEQRLQLANVMPQFESEIRSMEQPMVIFFNAVYTADSLRAQQGAFSQTLAYFTDPALSRSNLEKCMVAMVDYVLSLFLHHASNSMQPMAIAKQLAQLMVGCCHRVPRVQRMALTYADRVVTALPAALCQRSSLYALLELLTIMWTSCLEAELDEYSFKSTYTSVRGNVTVHLSDDFAARKSALAALQQHAERWMGIVIDIAPLHVKGLLQTYLAEYEDDGAYGHIALGRSFAMEMGAKISRAEPKLAAIDRDKGQCVNTASDFTAQYTSRLEYKHGVESTDQLDPLYQLDQRAKDGVFIPIGELRDVLRRIAALLCNGFLTGTKIIRRLVEIPFLIFSKQSIKLGISIWLNVMHEAPKLESLLLAIVAECWQRSIWAQRGVFSSKLRHPDPFYIKEEFAPSDKVDLLRKQQWMHNLIVPHLKLLQFLSSHFHATSLGSSHTIRIYHRLLLCTLKALRKTFAHPLTREFHFAVLNLAFTVSRHNSLAGLQDAALSAGLAWFRHPPRWSFGGNRLQIKADLHLLTVIESRIREIPSSTAKLLSLFVDSEKTRLSIWLEPVTHARRSFATRHSRGDEDKMLHIAWKADPHLALGLCHRFPSTFLMAEMRRKLLSEPQPVVDLPDALPVLLGASLSSDVSFQLKVGQNCYLFAGILGCGGALLVLEAGYISLIFILLKGGRVRIE